jgi:hypothetical protein
MIECETVRPVAVIAEYRKGAALPLHDLSCRDVAEQQITDAAVNRRACPRQTACDLRDFGRISDDVLQFRRHLRSPAVRVERSCGSLIRNVQHRCFQALMPLMRRFHQKRKCARGQQRFRGKSFVSQRPGDICVETRHSAKSPSSEPGGFGETCNSDAVWRRRLLSGDHNASGLGAGSAGHDERARL